MDKKNTKAFLLYKALLRAFGPQHWWPAKTPFEVVVGAILTQNTNWGNVEKAIGNLRKEGILTPSSMFYVRSSKLEKLIRSSGYYRQKTRKLKAFVEHLFKHHNGSLKRLFKQGKKTLREELLSIHGIGNETADSIILYAANKPSFVVDAYTRRIGHRLGIFKSNKYSRIQAYFERNLPRSVKIYNEFHALLVALAKINCKRDPICVNCPAEIACVYQNIRGSVGSRSADQKIR